ncbi:MULTISPECIES: tetratricopeptide repeat protein [Vibrio]|uniref:tetratricopeptide repeat protein n=1 Tax=Vibrio TaxID=662 RepID=UPI001BD655E3|nr:MULTISPECIES: tetratricopeptide repeat protein [Vibrio]MBS9896607.1 tetratricopeptide repeat protein [Vibrio alginolyticus]MBT0032658.1 tetratricopeptide repeat protein [Vibrio alginolyticus]MBY8205006.1 tetratricopeptide repeat protein [Vibrio fluvialis]MDW2327652.1 tetratricopeptide repeat protein [Vibrio sp. 1401]
MPNKMSRKIHSGLWLFCVLLLSGCSSFYQAFNSEGSQTQNLEKPLDFDQESLLIKTNNQAGLIELYKTQLQQQENPQIRFKLANAYFNGKDPESSLFTLAPLMTAKSSVARDELFFLQGRAQYQLGRIEQAQRSLLAALQVNPNSAKALNSISIIYAQQGEWRKAREGFNRARELMFDDVTVKNNLALIDILEQDYQSAAARLLPIYLNGQADDMVTANLALIMAKIGSFEHLRSFYGQQYSDEELYLAYLNLREMQLMNHMPAEASANSKSHLLQPNNNHTDIVIPVEEPKDASFVF